MCLFSCRFLFTTTACQSWAVASFGQKRKVTWFGALWLGRSLARREESPQWAIYVQTLPGILPNPLNPLLVWNSCLIRIPDTNHLATYLKNSEGAFVQANEPKSQVCPSNLETGPRSNSPGADHWPPQGPQSQSSMTKPEGLGGFRAHYKNKTGPSCALKSWCLQLIMDEPPEALYKQWIKDRV